MSYSFESTVRYSEAGQDGKLTWLRLLDYFQDCSVFHSESLEIGLDYLKEHHAAWVINHWQICVNRLPELCEEIVITTIPYEIKGFFGRRNFVMETKGGERLAYANSVWTLIDIETNLPTKVLPEMMRYELGKPLEMKTCDRKLKLPEKMEELYSFEVGTFLLDTNGHVNNGRYVEIAIGCLSQGGEPDADRSRKEPFQIEEMRVEYKRQARLGDLLVISKGSDDEKVTVAISGQDGKPYAIVQFMR